MKIRIKNKMSQVVDSRRYVGSNICRWELAIRSVPSRANITVCCQKPGTPLLNHASAQIICNLTKTEDMHFKVIGFCAQYLHSVIFYETSRMSK